MCSMLSGRGISSKLGLAFKWSNGDLISTDIRDMLKEFEFKGAIVLDIVIDGCAD